MSAVKHRTALMPSAARRINVSPTAKNLRWAGSGGSNLSACSENGRTECLSAPGHRYTLSRILGQVQGDAKAIDAKRHPDPGPLVRKQILASLERLDAHCGLAHILRGLNPNVSLLYNSENVYWGIHAETYSRELRG